MIESCLSPNNPDDKSSPWKQFPDITSHTAVEKILTDTTPGSPFYQHIWKWVWTHLQPLKSVLLDSCFKIRRYRWTVLLLRLSSLRRPFLYRQSNKLLNKRTVLNLAIALFQPLSTNHITSFRKSKNDDGICWTKSLNNVLTTHFLVDKALMKNCFSLF